MTAAQTSITTYRNLKSEGALSSQQAQIMAVIQRGCDYSLREIALLTGLENSSVAGRVNELKAAGLLVPAPKRNCSITGRLVAPNRLPAIKRAASVSKPASPRPVVQPSLFEAA